MLSHIYFWDTLINRYWSMSFLKTFLTKCLTVQTGPQLGDIVCIMDECPWLDILRCCGCGIRNEQQFTAETFFYEIGKHYGAGPNKVKYPQRIIPPPPELAVSTMHSRIDVLQGDARPIPFHPNSRGWTFIHHSGEPVSIYLRSCFAPP